MARLKSSELFKSLHKRNNGIFYRGTASGKGMGESVALGKGLYVTYDRKVAEAFADIIVSSKGGKPVIEKFKVPSNIKILDRESKTFIDIKKKYGLKAWENPANDLRATLITRDVRDVGYDGVISQDSFDGLVIFNGKKIKKVKR